MYVNIALTIASGLFISLIVYCVCKCRTCGNTDSHRGTYTPTPTENFDEFYNREHEDDYDHNLDDDDIDRGLDVQMTKIPVQISSTKKGKY